MKKAGARPALSGKGEFASAQAGDVVGHRLDLAIVHLQHHAGHLRAVGARAAAEGEQLRLGVVGMLAADARVLRGDAGAGGAVAAGAGRHLAVGQAAAVDLLAELDQVLVLREAGLGALAAVEGGDVLHVGLRQRRCEALHDRVLALAFLELGQLLGDVVGMLALQDGVGRAATRTIVGMAGGADLPGDRLAAREVGLERRLGRVGRLDGHGGREPGGGCGASSGKGGRGKGGGKQQGKGRLHVVCGRRWQNRAILQWRMNEPGTPPHNNEKAALAWTHTARFLTTASRLDQLPATELPEIAFVGRSNAGKSTAINTLAQQRRLAFASKTPGRTQHINLFEVGPKDAADALFADLPGYGYAAVERGAKLRWQQVMAEYLEVRRSLSGVVLMIDSRLGLTELDTQLLGFIAPRVGNGSVKLLVLLTKSDKLNRRESNEALAAAQAALGEMTTDEADVGVALFS